MSMFWCAICGDLSDSDDGCATTPNGRELICVDCAINLSDPDDDLEDGE